MEQIRRVNRLWASDSLFLRESLLIPVSRPDVTVSPTDMIDEDTNTPSIAGSTSNSDSEDRSISDILVKIDSSIATTKTQVKKSLGNSE